MPLPDLTLPDLAIGLLAGGAAAALGGALVVAPGAEEAERWVGALRAAVRARRPGAPWRLVPSAVDDDRLAGGLDVVATLAAGTQVRARGLLAEAAGGVLVLPRAAAASASTLARVADAVDRGGLTVVAVACGDAERADVPSMLADRLGLHVTLPAGYAPDPQAYGGGVVPAAPGAAPLARAQAEALCGVADALGIGSTRAAVLAVRTARAAAAGAARAAPNDDDLAAAVRLVLAPRATRVPAPEEASPNASPPEPPDAPGGEQPEPSASPPDATPDDAAEVPGDVGTREILVAAARAALPPELILAARAGAGGRATPAGASGRSPRGTQHADDRRGRRVGERPGRPRGGNRLDLVATLRSAAPWQSVRGRAVDGPLAVRRDDLHVERRRRPVGTTIVVVVDASGSAAFGRLAEAKGAAELLLAESYARRDRVALVAFRGSAADVVFPPTRALARARRAISALPAGGGTPLAAALVAAADLARQAARGASRPAVVLLTDGRANVAMDGTPGRERARGDAQCAARGLAEALHTSGGLAVVVDTAPRGGADARELAAAARARYVALPHASARALHGVVRGALGDDDSAPAPARRHAPDARLTHA